MVVRLVLGAGGLGTTVAEEFDERPGSVTVVTTDETRARGLRDRGITVTVGDPSAPGVLSALEPRPEVVAIVDDDGSTNLAAARAVRECFPDAYVVGYTGRTEAADPDDLAGLVDRVIDPTALLASSLLERVGPAGCRQRQLIAVLRDIDTLAVVAHENPDPDALGSAVALSRLAATAGCSAEVCYFGEISHQENRALVNLLEYDLTHLEPGADLSRFDGFALVDHSRPGVNDGLPEDLAIDVVIDHHPPRAPVEARFVDLRSDVGATSTLLVEYLEHFAIDIDEPVATGLLFGIRVDTDEFTREVAAADFEAAATLLPYVDFGTLERIETPSLSPETLDVLGRAIANRDLADGVLLTCVGRIGDRDALAQAADRLLELESVTTTVVYGVKEGTIYVSARARGSGIDLGETLRDAFGQIGNAGGHADMAGAQITLGVLEAVDDRDESLLEIVEAVVADRFREAMAARPGREVPGALASGEPLSEEYLVPGEAPDSSLSDETGPEGGSSDSPSDAEATDEQ